MPKPIYPLLLVLYSLLAALPTGLAAAELPFSVAEVQRRTLPMNKSLTG